MINRIGLDNSATESARNLLGCYIVRRNSDGIRRVRIVETEAYSEDDPASHSYNGPTERSRVMFGPPGNWYIYKCYGIHWMINVVTGEADQGEAVLIRGGEPVEGNEMMQKERGQSGVTLTNGPGKLAEALSVDEQFDGESVQSSTLYLEPGDLDQPIYESPRVGIDEGTERYWRYFYRNEYCSDVSQNDLARRRD